MCVVTVYYCGLLPLDLHILMVWGHYRNVDGKSKSTHDVTPYTQAYSKRDVFLFPLGDRSAGRKVN